MDRYKKGDSRNDRSVPYTLYTLLLSLNQTLDDTLLERKANREVMEPLSVRTDRVRSFLELFKPGLELDLVPITDVCGPTGWDPDIQALVVSKETLNGASISASLEAIQ